MRLLGHLRVLFGALRVRADRDLWLDIYLLHSNHCSSNFHLCRPALARRSYRTRVDAFAFDLADADYGQHEIALSNILSTWRSDLLAAANLNESAMKRRFSLKTFRHYQYQGSMQPSAQPESGSCASVLEKFWSFLTPNKVSICEPELATTLRRPCTVHLSSCALYNYLADD